ncbi:hypothetical protein DCAR_0729305 [Daucus carota subsp. sativus]|uniref:Uncharacterized protein n=1 Tax=Daucus carota subsp. sativus TaxID=79200 RepID=A0A164U4J6_DAUCS|nr:PREDICTED: uncharacterized protein LOC108195643 [Daucus carota subsp. sativus]WOH09845.1 hypothetical protein DCAR_0729305 [Daucus carota subsp. sativus]
MKSSISHHHFYTNISNKVIKEDEEEGIYVLKDEGFEEKITGNATGTRLSRGVATTEKVAAKNAEKPGDKKKVEDINESAEAFIKKFRKQLVIQRLESIENYENMLARGT